MLTRTQFFLGVGIRLQDKVGIVARSYISYDLDGRLASIVISDGPFPIDYDIESLDPQNPLAKEARNFHTEEIPTLAGFYAFDCACPYAPGQFCSCSSDAQKMKYYDNGDLINKPALTVKVDNVSTEAIVNKPPGSWVNVKLEADVPDSTQVTFKLDGATLSIDELVFTFNNGSTNSILLKAPAQGLIGHIYGGMDRYLPPITISIRGWA